MTEVVIQTISHDKTPQLPYMVAFKPAGHGDCDKHYSLASTMNLIMVTSMLYISKASSYQRKMKTTYGNG